jgi:hypothetical protein
MGHQVLIVDMFSQEAMAESVFVIPESALLFL